MTVKATVVEVKGETGAVVAGKVATSTSWRGPQPNSGMQHVVGNLNQRNQKLVLHGRKIFLDE
jgi:hypothetical protein